MAWRKLLDIRRVRVYVCILQGGWLDFILLKSGAQTLKRGHTGNPGLGIYEWGGVSTVDLGLLERAHNIDPL